MTKFATSASSEEQFVAVAAAALERVAGTLALERPLILAICDADGRPTDLLVRDQNGQVAVLAGIPENQRPALAGAVGLGGGQPAAADVDRGPQRGTRAARGAADVGLLVRTLAEHTPVPLMVVDRSDIILHASAFMHDFGYRAGELVGDRLLQYVHPDDRERLSHVRERLARGERAVTVDVRWRRQDGRYAMVEARIRASDDHRGSLAGAVVVALWPLPRPWTGPAELIAALHRQRALADGSPCGVAIVSGAEATLGRVLEANRPFGRIAAATTGQLIGSQLTSLVADSEVGRLGGVLEATGTHREPYKLETILKHPLSGGRRAEITVRANPDEAERNELIVCVREMTDQLRQVSELSATIERLERSNHELAEFARITAHDLCAPLLALSRLVELLADRDDHPDYSATLDAIRSGINRMRGMVDSVMGYSQSLEAPPERVPVNLDEVLRRVTHTLAEETSRRHALITAGQLPTVLGNEQQLERVLLNLVSNALKFANNGVPRVRIEGHHETEVWRISIADEGIGVSEDDRERIFELFARSADSVPGRGIGLATSRRIVELHGGRIWVEPNEPSGSIFQFTLPKQATVFSG